MYMAKCLLLIGFELVYIVHDILEIKNFVTESFYTLYLYVH